MLRHRGVGVSATKKSTLFMLAIGLALFVIAGAIAARGSSPLGQDIATPAGSPKPAVATNRASAAQASASQSFRRECVLCEGRLRRQERKRCFRRSRFRSELGERKLLERRRLRGRGRRFLRRARLLRAQCDSGRVAARSSGGRTR